MKDSQNLDLKQNLEMAMSDLKSGQRRIVNDVYDNHYISYIEAQQKQVYWPKMKIQDHLSVIERELLDKSTVANPFHKKAKSISNQKPDMNYTTLGNAKDMPMGKVRL